MSTGRLSHLLLSAPTLLAQMPGSETYRGGLVTPPLPKPTFTLRDTSGRPFDFGRDTRGSVSLLFFCYTWCPDQCPMHMASLSAALRRLPPGMGDQVKMAFVTADPARDTSEVLRSSLDLFDRRFFSLTGTEHAIAAVQPMAGIPVATASGSADGNYGLNRANFVLAYSKDNFRARDLT